MLKDDVIKFFKTQTAVAEVLEISKEAVSQWPDPIPELRARQLSEITKGKLRFRPEMYRRESAA